MKEEHLHKETGLITFANAKRLRKVPTEAEDILWNVLRNRKFLNLKFRRQHPLQSFIADFYCHELGLVIEIDGGYHNTPEQMQYDKERTLAFEKSGIRVVRLSNEEVMQVDSALEKIKLFIDSLKVPSPLGEG